MTFAALLLAQAQTQTQTQPARAAGAVNWLIILTLLGVVLVTCVLLVFTLRRARKRRAELHERSRSGAQPSPWQIAGQRAESPSPDELDEHA